MITLQSKIKIGSRKLEIGCGKPKTGVEKNKNICLSLRYVLPYIIVKIFAEGLIYRG